MARPRLVIPKLDIDCEFLTQKTMTLGEIAHLEKVLGQTLHSSDPHAMAVVNGVLWMSARRVRRDITLADVEALTQEDFDVIQPEGDAEDPSQAADPAEADDGDPTTSTPAAGNTSSA